MKHWIIVAGLLFSLVGTGCALQTSNDIEDQQHENKEAGKLTAVQFYVPSEKDNKISIIDIASSEVVGNIETKEKPTLVAFTSTMREAVVANQNSSSLSLFNTQTLNEEKEIPVGPLPHGIALAPDNDTVYVATVGDSYVDVVSLKEGKVIRQIDIGTGGNTNYLVLEDKLLYVTDYERHKLIVINTETDEIVHEITTGEVPRVVQVSDDIIYVAASSAGELQLFSAENGLPITSITGVPQITDFVIKEDQSQAIATSLEGNALYLIDLNTKEVISTLNNLAGAKHLAFNRLENRVYVTLSGTNLVQIVDLETFEVEKTIEVGAAPHGIKIKALPGGGGSC
jgi:YVTN family beta-propeller protein